MNLLGKILRKEFDLYLRAKDELEETPSNPGRRDRSVSLATPVVGVQDPK